VNQKKATSIQNQYNCEYFIVF